MVQQKHTTSFLDRICSVGAGNNWTQGSGGSTPLSSPSAICHLPSYRTSEVTIRNAAEERVTAAFDRIASLPKREPNARLGVLRHTSWQRSHVNWEELLVLVRVCLTNSPRQLKHEAGPHGTSSCDNPLALGRITKTSGPPSAWWW
jgi:hypothetical protein